MARKMKATAAIQPPERTDLEEMRSSGMTREEIADHYGVSVSTVKSWISSLGVKKKIVRKPKKTPAIKQIDLHPFDGMSGIEKAKQILGSRLKECSHRGYLLDGRPVSASKVMEAANLDNCVLNC